ncbi:MULTISPECIES: MocR-like pyridoxine biosynthesis transcription factor PdxR [unclassified Marinomonas]|uniref:MocR-like pyridoxine biosynthesis transcription factor PdxR n=1 Tax=unclassified Marinomonas TaxID=196814 RepID=UPI0007AF55D9|nr:MULTISPECIES: PLP-dependent aminotransferase family protein [unclassified Marinomonas]
MNESNAILRLTIDHQSGAARYRQLLEQFKGLFSGQYLQEGDKLPSSRELASMLGLSRSTTIKVYDILISEGYLVSQPKKGLYVAHMAALLPGELEPAKPPLLKREKSKKSILNEPMQLGSGIDVSAFPHKAWAASMRRSWLNPDIGVIQGEYHNGLPRLKEYLADYLANVRGLECDQEQIIITSGNRDALSIMSHALLSDYQDEARVWLENPCFPAMSRFFQWLGRDLKPLPVDQEGAATPKLTHAKPNHLHLALITPNRQYPLGMAMSSLRRQEWLTLLSQVNSHVESRVQVKDAGLWVIEDDYDNEFYYQGRLGVPLMNLDESQRTFLLGSFSKIMFRGLRLGYIVAPKAHIERIKKSQRQLGPSASLPMQSALLDFMEHGHFNAHLRRMRRLYRDKRDYLEIQINHYLGKYCDWQKPNGGMHTLVYLKEKWIQKWRELEHNKLACLDQALMESLLKKGMHISALSPYYFEKNNIKQGFVLGFTEPSKADIVTILAAAEKQLSLFLQQK